MPGKIFSVQSVMLAEDDEDDKYIFADVLQDIDPSLKMEYVPNGAKLMDLLQHFVPDLLFLDLEMPYKNGLECLVEIRNNEKLKNLPVVVFSSTTRPANIQTAYDMGANLFLIKSSSVNEYTKALNTILQLDWSKPDKVKEQYCINGRYAVFT